MTLTTLPRLWAFAETYWRSRVVVFSGRLEHAKKPSYPSYPSALLLPYNSLTYFDKKVEE
jgi:hypothetical protein